MLSNYYVTSLGDHPIHIIPAEDTIKIILRVQKQTVTHLHNSLPMDNGDQTWLHIDHKQNNALTWWVSVAVGEIYYHTEETINNKQPLNNDNKKQRSMFLLKKSCTYKTSWTKLIEVKWILFNKFYNGLQGENTAEQLHCQRLKWLQIEANNTFNEQAQNNFNN